ncbi:MAG: hypothetical protein JW384_02330 [Nitrosomonadaceae bacterium]|nr:hypothetical protein [Nitrosomonadaceae bacterium]
MPSYEEVVTRSISLVLDNDEIAYFWIRQLAAESSSVIELGACIHDYYVELVANTLDQGPDGLGAMLIREMCFGQPSSVFEDIARHYWDEREEEE